MRRVRSATSPEKPTVLHVRHDGRSYQERTLRPWQNSLKSSPRFNTRFTLQSPCFSNWFYSNGQLLRWANLSGQWPLATEVKRHEKRHLEISGSRAGSNLRIRPFGSTV